MFKEVSSTIAAGVSDKVVMVGLLSDGLKERESHCHSSEIWRVRVWSRFLPKFLFVQAFKYLEWCGRIICRFWRQDIRVLHAHSLNALPVSVVLKFFTGAKLVYDAHELEIERNGLEGIRKKISQVVELFCLRFADGVIVVSDSIAEFYREQYKSVCPVVVRNIPAKALLTRHKEISLRQELSLNEDDLIFLYLGVLARGRGIPEMVRAFEGHGGKSHIVFMGEGELSNEIKESQQKSSRIHLIPPVSPSDVLACASEADIGCCLIDDICLSYRYSLPNKLFEYLFAGVPVLINDLPEQRKIIEKFDCGWVLPIGESCISEFLTNITVRQIESKKDGVAHARQSFDWSHEEKRLLSLYRSISPVP